MAARWYRCVVGDPLLVAEPFAELTRQFASRYPPGSAARLVTRLESGAGLHCVAVAYLSPEAEELALQLGAVPCHPPPVAG